MSCLKDQYQISDVLISFAVIDKFGLMIGRVVIAMYHMLILIVVACLDCGITD